MPIITEKRTKPPPMIKPVKNERREWRKIFLYAILRMTMRLLLAEGYYLLF